MVTGRLHRVADAAEGLALEAELFGTAQAGLRFWTARAPALVCPSAYERRDGFARTVERSAARGWPVVTRPSGGGCVPQGPGVLNIAMVATVDKGMTIEDGYRAITGVIQAALAPCGVPLEPGSTPQSFCDGAWNLSISGRKVVGTAQRWRPSGGRVRVLIHALILTDGNIGPGATAVDAFHTDLGLNGPVRAEVHTTLQAELGEEAPGPEALVEALEPEARATLARLVGRTEDVGTA